MYTCNNQNKKSISLVFYDIQFNGKKLNSEDCNYHSALSTQRPPRQHHVNTQEGGLNLFYPTKFMVTFSR